VTGGLTAARLGAVFPAEGPATVVTGLAVAVAVLGAGAVIAPVIVLAGVLGLVLVAVCLSNLAAGLAAFTVLIFLDRIPTLGTGITFVKLAGAVLAASWLLTILQPGGDSKLLVRRHPGLTAVAFGLVVWTLASLLWAPDAGAAAAVEFRLLQGMLLLFIGFSAIRERKHLNWVIGAFIVGATLSALVGLAGYTAPEHPGTPGGGGTERLTGGIGDPNELAAILVPALTFALFALATVRSHVVRWALWASVVIGALALFKTESRGGLLAMGAVFVAVLVLGGPVRARAVPVILISLCAALAYYTLVAPPEALARVTEFRSGGGSGRTDLWTVALEVFGDHPVTGVGIGNFQVVEPLYALRDVSIHRIDFVVERALVVHNTYLHILAELGLVGFMLFGALIAGALGVGLRATRAFVRSGDRDAEILARGVLIGTIGMLAAFFFISAQYEKQLPLLLGVLAALSSVAVADRARPGGMPPTVGEMPALPPSREAA
jgi:O-antigen ligase